MKETLSAGVLRRNPAWIQLLGLCPLLAVSTSVANAVGLSMATAFVLCGSNTLIAVLRHNIPQFARLPLFVLIIATFTTIAVLLLEAYAFELYVRVALFVQIIVTNCMILGRAESFASKQPPLHALLDALGTAIGFAIALLALGAAREIIGQGTVFAGLDQLFGPSAAALEVTILPQQFNVIAAKLPPGAFIIAGLLLAGLQAAYNAKNSKEPNIEPDQTR